MNIALINGTTVVNIIDADLVFAQTLGYTLAVEATPDAYIGGQYSNGAFVPAPVVTPILVTTNVISKEQLLKRFTAAERQTIEAAGATDPNIADAQMMDQQADNIDVTDPDTVNYVNYLASKAYIDPSRVSAILAPEAI